MSGLLIIMFKANVHWCPTRMHNYFHLIVRSINYLAPNFWVKYRLRRQFLDKWAGISLQKEKMIGWFRNLGNAFQNNLFRLSPSGKKGNYWVLKRVCACIYICAGWLRSLHSNSLALSSIVKAHCSPSLSSEHFATNQVSTICNKQSNGLNNQIDSWQASGNLQQILLLHVPHHQNTDSQFWCKPNCLWAWRASKWAPTRKGTGRVRQKTKRAGCLHRGRIGGRSKWGHEPPCQGKASPIAEAG